MRIALAIVSSIGLALAASGAAADSYSRSIDGCKAAIGERLGLENVPAQYRVKTVKSKTRYRDLGFLVSANDDTSPVQGVIVNCKAKTNGQVLALDFPEDLPGAIATQ